jgi:hypothetical protein
MTYSVSVPRTLAIIAVLTVALFGLEHAVSGLLTLLRGIAAGSRILLFFTTSLVTVGAGHVFRARAGTHDEVDDDHEYLFDDDLLYHGEEDIDQYPEYYYAESDSDSSSNGSYTGARPARSLAPRCVLNDLLTTTWTLTASFSPSSVSDRSIPPAPQNQSAAGARHPCVAKALPISLPLTLEMCPGLPFMQPRMYRYSILVHRHNRASSFHPS